MEWGAYGRRTCPTKNCKNVWVVLTTPQYEVMGKKVNRGGGYGLEIQVCYKVMGPEKAVMWIKNKLRILDDDLTNK